MHWENFNNNNELWQINFQKTDLQIYHLVNSFEICMHNNNFNTI